MSRLVYEEHSIEIGGEHITLRPSLRAASLILARHGDLTSIFKALVETNVGTIADLIRIGSGQRLPHLHYALCGRLHDLHERAPIVETLQAFLVALVKVGADDDMKATKPTKRSKSKPAELKPDELIGTLFTMGTGVLGWSPEQTWNATPSEIVAAHGGRISFVSDILRAVFPSDDKGKREYDPLDTERDEDGFAALRMMAGTTGAGVR